MTAKKIVGDVGNSGFNTSLGKPNETPAPRGTPGTSLKRAGVTPLSTRLPYNSSKGEIKDHKGL
tara:strand:+ start:514 stop:705 length:192 start_codon:yes stop_codon:yes gene_type:complete